MPSLRAVASSSLLWATFSVVGVPACSGSDPATATSSSASNADAGCKKFCAAAADLASTCVDAQNEAHVMPQALCENLCMNPECYTPSGSNPQAVKAFFTCAKSAPQTSCDYVDGLAMPDGCDTQGYRDWIAGWEYNGKKSVCN